MPTLADQIAPKPQQPSGLGGWLASIGDEMAGAFARYGRRSGAQRDASLALLNQASAPGTDPIMGAGQKLLGLAGLVTHPLAFFPTREEWDQRLQAAGNDSRIGRSIGGFLSDLPSLIDPQMAAGGAATVAPAIFAGMMAKTADLNKLKQFDELLDVGETSFPEMWNKSGWGVTHDGRKFFEIDDSASSVSDLSRLHSGAEVPISSVFKHDDLFAAYPQMQSAIIQATDIPKGSASFVPWRGSFKIEVSKHDTDPAVIRSNILHELNHGVQNIEGFEQGGSPVIFGSEGYNRLMGEVASRNVQTRADMNHLQRRASHPWDTEDVEPDMQLSQRESLALAASTSPKMMRELRQNAYGDGLWYPVDGFGNWHDKGFQTREEALREMGRYNRELGGYK